jgi:hemerythrin-like domain-containing protein
MEIVMAGTKAAGSMTREMVMVHTAVLREFGHLPELVRGVVEGDRGRAKIVADHIELISTVLHHHHKGEDRALWPRLLERCPEEVAPLVHGMETHHERIAALLSELTNGIAAWRADANAASCDTVVRTLESLLPVLREHLDAEVKYVLPLVEKHITGDEWDAMVAEGAGELPQDQLPLVLGVMMYEGDPVAVKDALDNLPAEVRPVIAETAPRLYGDYAEGVYGTRTPPFGYTLTDHA